jgi:hypothetical protein
MAQMAPYMKDALNLAYRDVASPVLDLDNLTLDDLLKLFQRAEEYRRNLEFEEAERLLEAEGEWPVGCEY